MGCRTTILLIGAVIAIISSVFTGNFTDFKQGVGILVIFGVVFLISSFLQRND